MRRLRMVAQAMFLMCPLLQVTSALAVPVHCLDLTTAGASGFVNGAFFQQITLRPARTGVTDPFLRIRATRTEEGFNNSVDAFTLDDLAKGGQTYNHDIQLSAIPVVKLKGVNYYQFLLDINEPNGAQSNVSLHELEIWLKASPITTFAGSTGVYTDLSLSGAVKKYDLNGAGDYHIKLNCDLNRGTESGDMFAYIPVSVLGTDNSKYVYLYSAFGRPTASDAGFEEWSFIRKGQYDVPEPTALILFGTCLLGLAIARKRLPRTSR